MLPVCGRLSAAACCVEELSARIVEGLFDGPEEGLCVRRVKILSVRIVKGLFSGPVEGPSVRRRLKVLPAPIDDGRSIVVSLEGPSFNDKFAIKSLN